MEHYHSTNGASGFICPRCGGALWERRNGDALDFECRIGDALSAAELWIEHCAARNRALKEAARFLAENAALARKLADWTRERGNLVAAAALEEQAEEGDRLHGQVRATLEGLPEADPDVAR